MRQEIQTSAIDSGIVKKIDEKGIDKSPVAPTSRGITLRSMLLSLLLAAIFGYCIPIVDYKLPNTFLGARHMPAGAVFVLLSLQRRFSIST